MDCALWLWIRAERVGKAVGSEEWERKERERDGIGVYVSGNGRRLREDWRRRPRLGGE